MSAFKSFRPSTHARRHQNRNDFINYEVTSFALYKINLFKVLLLHCFELNHGTPVYCLAKRIPPKHNGAAKTTTEVMLQIGINSFTPSTWSFPVLLATKKSVKPDFCVDSLVLSQTVKLDEFPFQTFERFLTIFLATPYSQPWICFPITVRTTYPKNFITTTIFV